MTPRDQMAARGCLLVVVAAVTFAGLRWCDGGDGGALRGPAWAVGGTLHTATLKQWNLADANNRLATAAELTIILKEMSEADVTAMLAADDLAALRLDATALVACIDVIASAGAELIGATVPTAAGICSIQQLDWGAGAEDEAAP